VLRQLIFASFPVVLKLMAGTALFAAVGSVSGTITDPQGRPVSDAVVVALENHDSKIAETRSDAAGQFSFASLPVGNYRLAGTAIGFADASERISIAEGEALTVNLRFDHVASHNDAVTVTADVRNLGIQNPDPAQRVLVRDELLDANPGRPGPPVSIPGIPIETASGGIKAPQYFAPGVAGDHGEPIASFIQVGSFLLSNNLSANAHGNGYSDPNIMVPALIESVQVDGGAFNVREGNHSVDLSATYGLRARLEPFATVTGDYRDIDVSAGWNWLAVQASYGNGFLDTLEHRQQYKLNALKTWNVGAHQISGLFLGYYGQSMLPGLVPLDVPNLHDTIDRRQRDQTHTGEAAVNDVWRVSEESELQLSGFFRTYNLSLYSNFGDGLIRQSEFRTVAGGNGNYIRRVSRHLTLMAGMDYLREAPRRDDLDRYPSTNPYVYGPFQLVTANDITINLVSPFIAVDGTITRWLRYNLGWRRGQIGFDNTDLLFSANSFHRWVGVNSPKATLAIVAPEFSQLPTVSLSWGQSFFTNDPRIGTGTERGSLVSQAHAWQLVASKTIAKTDFRVTLGHITQEASLAKIDPDSGLQFNEGPSRNRYVTFSARRYFRGGLLQGSVSKADARDLSDGSPVSEAPRLIFEMMGTLDRLPFGLHARAEFEEVGSRPLGDGFVSVPAREFRGALVRQFMGGRLSAGVHFQISQGYTGQTTEVLALPDASERVVGVYLPSYATASVSYRFGR
jgi:hypothetical protein